MADDLTKMWGSFSLSDDDGEVMEINMNLMANPVNRGQSCVVGKLVSEKWVSKETIKSKLVQWWRPTEMISFKVLGDNLFLIEFKNLGDKSRVLEGRLWIFEGSLFAVKDFEGVTPPAEIDFDKVAFWVRMVNMPLACMCKEIGFQIGASIGTVEEVDTDEEGIGWGEYFQVRIQIDLKKPLLCGKMLKVQGRTVRVLFQYERLPIYCFHCGCISHGVVGCLNKRGLKMKGEGAQYEPWLRAESPSKRREREQRCLGGWGEYGKGCFPSMVGRHGHSYS
jgi:hypothetical protein